MFPLLMLAAQLVSKQQQEQEARRREVAKLAEERAARLGGNTMGVEAANFNRELKNQSYASPDQLLKIYGSFGQDDKKQPKPPWTGGGPSGNGNELVTPPAWQVPDDTSSIDSAGSLLDENDPYGIGTTV